MSDRLHTHETHGFVRGCPACIQTRDAIRRGRASLATYALTNRAEVQREKEAQPA